MKLTKEQIDKIMEDFPAKALSKDTSRGFELTSIKAMYVVLRLNDVFGITGWGYEFTEPQEKKGEYFTKVTLKIYSEGDTHTISQYGGKKIVRENVTDAYKSSITDGLTKCASILGIGHKVFKGESLVGKETKSKNTSQTNHPTEDEEIRTRTSTMIKEMFDLPDVKAYEDQVEGYSGFEGKDGWVKGKRSLKDLSPKWLRNTYANVKEDHKNWQESKK